MCILIIVWRTDRRVTATGVYTDYCLEDRQESYSNRCVLIIVWRTDRRVTATGVC